MGKIMDIEKEFERVEENFEKRNKVIKSLNESAFMDLVALVENTMRAEKVPAVFVYGWTPGFNDGDPCTHSQNLSEEPLDDLHSSFENPEEEFGKELMEEICSEEDPDIHFVREYYWRQSESKHPEKIKNKKRLGRLLMGARDIFKKRFGTDWKLTFWINKGGEFQHKKEYYNCGF